MMNQPAGFSPTTSEIKKAHLLKTKLTLMITLMNYNAVKIKCRENGFCVLIFLLFNSSTIYVSGAGNNTIQKFGVTLYL